MVGAGLVSPEGRVVVTYCPKGLSNLEPPSPIETTMDAAGRRSCDVFVDVVLPLVHGIQNSSCTMEEAPSKLLFLVGGDSSRRGIDD